MRDLTIRRGKPSPRNLLFSFPPILSAEGVAMKFDVTLREAQFITGTDADLLLFARFCSGGRR